MDEPIIAGYIAVSDGRITTVGAGTPRPDLLGERINAQGQTLTPGLIDIHTHGIHTHCYDQGPEALAQATAILPQYGTTTVIPTVVPKIDAAIFDFLAGITSVQTKGASIPGIHIEGPFVAITGAACDTRDGDIALLNDLLDACNDKAAVMSIAPEVNNIIPVIERLVERGVTPFITHTRASVEQTTAAIDAGARHATHFYDVFPIPEETDPGVRPVGVVETILADPRATCDFICDGVHVHPMAIHAAVAAKGWQGVILITDASFGAGMPPGRYETPWGYPVEVAPGNAPRIADPAHPMHGGLAGSALTMDQGIGNLMQWLDLPPQHVWAMGTANPARVIGAESKGALAPGNDADLVLWDSQGQATRTWVGGNIVFDRKDIDNV